MLTWRVAMKTAACLVVLTLAGLARADEEVIKVTAADLLNEYKQGADDADKKYKGKMVQVEARVWAVARDTNRTAYLKIGGPKDPGKDLLACYFRPKWAIAETDWKSKAGYTYKIRGTCNGMGGKT